VVSLQNEVDRQNQAHDYAEQLARPVLDRQQERGCRAAGKSLHPGNDVVAIDLIRERDAVQLLQKNRKPHRRFL